MVNSEIYLISWLLNVVINIVFKARYMYVCVL
jgi:hypothetical protein